MLQGITKLPTGDTKSADAAGSSPEADIPPAAPRGERAERSPEKISKDAEKPDAQEIVSHHRQLLHPPQAAQGKLPFRAPPLKKVISEPEVESTELNILCLTHLTWLWQTASVKAWVSDQVSTALKKMERNTGRPEPNLNMVPSPAFKRGRPCDGYQALASSAKVRKSSQTNFCFISHHNESLLFLRSTARHRFHVCSSRWSTEQRRGIKRTRRASPTGAASISVRCTIGEQSLSVEGMFHN